MKIMLHDSLGGMNAVVRTEMKPAIKAKIITILKQIADEKLGKSNLNFLNTKKMQGVKANVYEVIINNWRLFYTIEGDTFYILEVLQKKSQKIGKQTLANIVKKAKKK